MAPFDSVIPPAAAEPAPLEPVTPATFKEVLARLAGGLAIISYWDGDRPAGLLVSSITGLSVEPPRFLFCVQKRSSGHDALLRAKACGVAILSANEHPEVQTFIDADLRHQRFKSDRWRLLAPAPPMIDAALSSSACTIDTSIDAGSHTILIVTAKCVRVADGAPLLAFNRGLRTLAL